MITKTFMNEKIDFDTVEMCVKSNLLLGFDIYVKQTNKIQEKRNAVPIGQEKATNNTDIQT